MHKEVYVRKFAQAYEGYVSILKAIGFAANDERILCRVAGGEAKSEALKQILELHRTGELNVQTLEVRTLERMEQLREDLIAKIQPEASRLESGNLPKPAGAEGLAEWVAALPEDGRDTLADVILLDGHRDMVQQRKMSVEEFRGLLREFAGNQTIARKKLVEYLRSELLRRGIHMSSETIEERFRSSPAVRTMPHCVRRIFKSLGDEFRTGLVHIEELVGNEDPDQWLRRVQNLLKFRSQSSMHKAIAEATGLSYDCIHKALAGKKKAKRIQLQIKLCLDEWIAKAQSGEALGIAEERQGVPVDELCALMPRLQQSYHTKETVYRLISERTGIRTGSIRRYFQDDGQLKFAPPQVLRVATELAESPVLVVRKEAASAKPQARQRQSSRRDPDRAGGIARVAGQVLERWRHDRDNEQLQRQFKDLRLKLIVELSEKRRRSLSLV